MVYSYTLYRSAESDCYSADFAMWKKNLERV